MLSDATTGMFITANAPACTMFGYTKEEIVGQNVGMISSGVGESHYAIR
jgi:PAS domain S-box-containing protein